MHLILNIKYEEIKNVINKKIEEFFKFYDICLSYNQNNQPLNQIFKKILLENNKVADNPKILANAPLNTNYKNRVIIISDSLTEEFKFDQKLLFLMKRQVR